MQSALTNMGLAAHIPAFLEQAVTHDMSPDLTEAELQHDLGVSDPAERAKFMREIQAQIAAHAAEREGRNE